MKIVVLAAGYATRLYPLTLNQPKALLKVADKTILEHILARTTGIEPNLDITIVTNDKFYTPFVNWAKNQSHLGQIHVLNDQTTSNDNRLGAIGDLQFAMKERQLNDDLLVLASDNLFDQDLKSFVQKAKSFKRPSITLGAYDIRDPKLASNRYGVLEIDKENRVTSIHEKVADPPSPLVSMGVYFMSKESLPFIHKYLSSEQKMDAPGHYLKWMLQEISLYGVLFEGQWYDIGSTDQLEEANKLYLKPNHKK